MQRRSNIGSSKRAVARFDLEKGALAVRARHTTAPLTGTFDRRLRAPHPAYGEDISSRHARCFAAAQTNYEQSFNLSFSFQTSMPEKIDSKAESNEGSHVLGQDEPGELSPAKLLSAKYRAARMIHKNITKKDFETVMSPDLQPQSLRTISTATNRQTTLVSTDRMCLKWGEQLSAKRNETNEKSSGWQSKTEDLIRKGLKDYEGVITDDSKHDTTRLVGQLKVFPGSNKSTFKIKLVTSLIDPSNPETEPVPITDVTEDGAVEFKRARRWKDVMSGCSTN
ncbi:hypothetical protein P7C73_g1113, partial [Tremellales sp. Uapishka_1]